MRSGLVRYTKVLAIVGDILEVALSECDPEADDKPCFGDLALVGNADEERRLAQVIRLDGSVASLQVFTGTKGLSTAATVRFLGRPPEVTFSPNILGRVFGGIGPPIDGGADLDHDPRIAIGGPSANPARRVLASKMIRTDLPMIDVFNCLVESQKIPIFSTAGEPFNAFMARIGIQADADIIVFGGLGLVFDDYWFFRKSFEDAGMFSRAVRIVNQASDPVIERLLVPDMYLAIAERFAVDEKRRVLVLLIDMTGYADALKEVGIAMERVPSNRGYMGDLYSQMARRYEKACDFKGGGSVTIVPVVTMPGSDVTHPVPDNTGHITEGQFYLKDGRIEPFGSLSRLKQHVIGKRTRDDDGVRSLCVRPSAPAVRAALRAAVHGHRRLNAARGGAGSRLADHGRLLLAWRAPHEGQAHREVLSGRCPRPGTRRPRPARCRARASARRGAGSRLIAGFFPRSISNDAS